MTLKELIKQNEGTEKRNGRHILYKCSADKWTCCYGHNAEDNGFSDAVAELLLEEDIQRAYYDIISIFPGFCFFTEGRRNALIDMMFNLGKKRFLKFKKMIERIEMDDWEGAAKEAEDSKWFKQVGNRAVRDVSLLRGK